jgi:hypothetical protein
MENGKWKMETVKNFRKNKVAIWFRFPVLLEKVFFDSTFPFNWKSGPCGLLSWSTQLVTLSKL